MSNKNFMGYGDAESILTEYANDIKSRVSTKANQGLTAQQIANAKANIDIDKVPNVATNDQTPTFLEESTRTNIASGDKLSLIFGKIKKFLSDLKTVAFTGSYNDLTDKIVFDNVPTQNSNNAVKSGGIFSTMAVPKYDATNRREYYEGGSAFSGNIDSSPTAGSNNAVASGGTYTAINERVKCGVFTTPDQTIAANTHMNINHIPATLPSTTIGMCIMDSPNSAWVFAYVREFGTTYVSLGIFNTASSSLTGKFKILYFYT